MKDLAERINNLLSELPPPPWSVEFEGDIGKWDGGMPTELLLLALFVNAWDSGELIVKKD
jgi:hypothetical protein